MKGIIFHERNWHRIQRVQMGQSDGRKVQQGRDHTPDPPHGPGGEGHSHEGGGEHEEGEEGDEGGGRQQNGSHGSGGSPLRNLA